MSLQFDLLPVRIRKHNSKQDFAGQDLLFKANEINYQGKSKRKARQDPLFKANECAIKQKE